jgi:3-phenylpropionate/trans-cinnamate dioxygenase ferredoxin reductase component
MRIVVVGASLAGLRAAQALRSAGHAGELVVVGDEQRLPYTRPPLSKELLAGAHTVEQCDFPAADLDVTWRLGSAATGLDRERREVVLADGERLGYDRLIVATGCRARTWTGPGAELAGLHTLRDIDDTLALRRELEHGSPRVAVVGAGFVGAEVAATARRLGLDVTLIDVAPHPLLPLGPELGARCAQLHRDHGVELRLATGVKGFRGSGAAGTGGTGEGAAGVRGARDGGGVVEGAVDRSGDAGAAGAAGAAGGAGGSAGAAADVAADRAAAPRERVAAVVLADGNEVPADVVVVALGALPNTEWLADSGLTLNPGVVCDATLTSVDDEHVLCAGDATSWPHPLADGATIRVEHWTNAAEQGAAAARNALAPVAERTPYVAAPYFWSDQYDVKIQAVGLPGRAERMEILEQSPEGDRLVAVGVRDGKVVAAVAFNAVRRLAWYRRQLADPPSFEQVAAAVAADERSLGAPSGVGA